MRRNMTRRKKKRVRRVKTVKCRLTKEQGDFLDYKDIFTLELFVTQQGKIMSRKRTGCTAQQQRMVAQAIKNARHMALLPFIAH
jgi:small subunit ribosomal protein S18